MINFNIFLIMTILLNVLRILSNTDVTHCAIRYSKGELLIHWALADIRRQESAA